MPRAIVNRLLLLVNEAVNNVLANPAHQPPSSRSAAGRGALLLYALVLVYASLNPFVGWYWPEVITLFVWPKHITSFDVVINVIAYLPLGVMLASMLRRRLIRAQRRHPLLMAWLMTLLLAGIFSATMEFIQAFLPTRVSSPLDLLTNACGALVGATAVLLPPGRRMIAMFELWRMRQFAHERETDWGIVLLIVWYLAQLNPAIPFFEAGFVTNATEEISTALSYDPFVLLPQALGIALNVTAFALLISILLHPKKRVLPNVVFMITIGLVAKLAMATLLLKAPLLAKSLSPATVIGVIAGIMFFTCFMRLTYRWRAFWATLIVFAGGFLTKISSVYTALDETLKLFSWSYGQLGNFASLTRWLNEIWPLMAMLLSALIFLRDSKIAESATNVSINRTPETE